MIRPNELRIGNLIKSDTGLLSSSEFEFLTVSYLKKDLLFFEEVQMIGELPEDCAGIPLTEEWLLSFGFSQLVIGKGLTDEFEKDSIILAMPTNEGAGFQVCIEKKYINLNIVWVHQLQNLYFAHTGEELTIE